MAVAAAVAAKLTLIDSATISKKLCNSLMVMTLLFGVIDGVFAFGSARLIEEAFYR
jgi:hypothetical protein